MLFKIGVGSITQVKTLTEVRCQGAGPFILTDVTAVPAKEKVVPAFLRVPKQGAGPLIEGCQDRTETTDVIKIMEKVATEILLYGIRRALLGCVPAMTGRLNRLFRRSGLGRDRLNRLFRRSGPGRGRLVRLFRRSGLGRGRLNRLFRRVGPGRDRLVRKCS